MEQKHLINRLNAATIFAALAISASPSYAQERVIEETLIYKDPTVALAGKWGSGVSVDYYNLKNSTPQFGRPADYSFGQHGLSGWVGYGDISVLLSVKKGGGTQAAVFPDIGPSKGDVDRKETEIALRWLMRSFSTSFMTPYLVAGYVDGKLDTTYSFSNDPGKIYYVRDYNAPLVGIGAIIPFSEKIGMRVDGKYLWSDNKTATSSAGLTTLKSEFSAKRYRATVTGYLNISGGLNLQAGYRFEKNQNSENSADKSVYAMLGYSFK